MSVGLRIKSPRAEFIANAHAIKGSTDGIVRLHVSGLDVKGHFDHIDIELTRADEIKWHEGLMRRLGLRFTPKSPIPRKCTRHPDGQGTSKFTGVHKDKRKCQKPWVAQIHFNRLTKVKCFAEEVDAAKQYNEWVIENKLNRPLNTIPE